MDSRLFPTDAGSGGKRVGVGCLLGPRGPWSAGNRAPGAVARWSALVAYDGELADRIRVNSQRETFGLIIRRSS